MGKQTTFYGLVALVAVPVVVSWALDGDVDEEGSGVDSVSSHEGHHRERTRSERPGADLIADVPTPSSSMALYSDVIRKRVESRGRTITMPDPPAMRSPSGELDAFQCSPTDESCDLQSPFSAKSWDEAQWMRRMGFVDASQIEKAARWDSEELDQRLKLGDPAAVAELASRFLSDGHELEAKEVLTDGVRGGNVFAAHRLADIDRGRSLPFYSRPGLEWLLIARRMGDTQVDMSYIHSLYPNLEPSELDHAMLVADRTAEHYRLNAIPVSRRPER